MESQAIHSTTSVTEKGLDPIESIIPDWIFYMVHHVLSTCLISSTDFEDMLVNDSGLHLLLPEESGLKDAERAAAEEIGHLLQSAVSTYFGQNSPRAKMIGGICPCICMALRKALLASLGYPACRIPSVLFIKGRSGEGIHYAYGILRNRKGKWEEMKTESSKLPTCMQHAVHDSTGRRYEALSKMEANVYLEAATYTLLLFVRERLGNECRYECDVNNQRNITLLAENRDKYMRLMNTASSHNPFDWTGSAAVYRIVYEMFIQAMLFDGDKKKLTSYDTKFRKYNVMAKTKQAHKDLQYRLKLLIQEARKSNGIPKPVHAATYSLMLHKWISNAMMKASAIFHDDNISCKDIPGVSICVNGSRCVKTTDCSALQDFDSIDPSDYPFIQLCEGNWNAFLNTNSHSYIHAATVLCLYALWGQNRTTKAVKSIDCLSSDSPLATNEHTYDAQLPSDIDSLIQSIEEFADVTFILGMTDEGAYIEEEEKRPHVKGHASCFALASGHCKSMLCGSTCKVRSQLNPESDTSEQPSAKKLKVDNLQPDIFLPFVCPLMFRCLQIWVYGRDSLATIEHAGDRLTELADLAIQMEMPALNAACLNHITENLINEHTMVTFAIYAHDRIKKTEHAESFKELRQACVEYMRSHCRNLLYQPMVIKNAGQGTGVECLDEELMKQVFEGGELNGGHENHLPLLLLRWFLWDPPQRSSYFKELLVEHVYLDKVCEGFDFANLCLLQFDAECNDNKHKHVPCYKMPGDWNQIQNVFARIKYEGYYKRRQVSLHGHPSWRVCPHRFLSPMDCKFKRNVKKCECNMPPSDPELWGPKKRGWYYNPLPTLRPCCLLQKWYDWACSEALILD